MEPILRTPRMDTKDAVVGLVVAAMHADGRALRAELQTASLHLEALDAVDVSVHDVRVRAERLEAALGDVGEDAFLARCADALPADLRLPVLKAVVAVVAADDDVHDAEARFLLDLARRLDVPERQVEVALLR